MASSRVRAAGSGAGNSSPGVRSSASLAATRRNPEAAGVGTFGLCGADCGNSPRLTEPAMTALPAADDGSFAVSDRLATKFNLQPAKSTAPSASAPPYRLITGSPSHSSIQHDADYPLISACSAALPQFVRAAHTEFMFEEPERAQTIANSDSPECHNCHQVHVLWRDG